MPPRGGHDPVPPYSPLEAEMQIDSNPFTHGPSPRRTAVRAAWLLGAALVAVVALPRAAAGQRDFRWSGALAAGQRVEVKGVTGDIRAEPSGGSEVEITAVRRAGRRGSAEEVRVETVRHGDGVTVCAVYPAPAGKPANRCTAGEGWEVNNQDNDTRVDFVVRVPRGVHFLGATVNGRVQARSMPADATVSSVNGAVEVSAAGIVEASTVNGNIDAATGTAAPGRDLRFQTVNGNITLRVPADFGARVHASMLNGELVSDFPLTMSRGRFVGRSAQGEIGRGGRTLHLETINGAIRIRRAGG